MTNKDPRAARMPWISPYLMVSDADASLKFYKDAFGFEGATVMKDDDGKIVHAELLYKNLVVAMFAPEGAMGSTEKTPNNGGFDIPVGFYVYCDDVDAMAAQASGADAEILREPTDQFYGDRTVTIADPDGYRWTFANNFEEFDPSKSPE